MPRLNGTGPRGEGSMTGRGLGNCNQEINNTTENNTPVENDIPVGRGLGMGKGFGRGLQRPVGRCFRGGSGRGRW